MTHTSTVEFGSYPQTEEGDELPITWYAIAERDGMLLLLAERALDCMRYNEAAGATTWQTSNLRTWLNGEFFDTAFDEDERAAIVEVKLDNPDNADFGVPGGDAAADKVFCLSLDELGLYFGVRSTKQLGREYPHLIALPTSYAMARGLTPTRGRRGPQGRCLLSSSPRRPPASAPNHTLRDPGARFVGVFPGCSKRAGLVGPAVRDMRGTSGRTL